MLTPQTPGRKPAHRFGAGTRNDVCGARVLQHVVLMLQHVVLVLLAQTMCGV
jgi:hypothetical protein